MPLSPCKLSLSRVSATSATSAASATARGLPRVGATEGAGVLPALLFMPVIPLDARIQGGLRGRADRI